MDIPFWAFCALLVALVYVSLRYFAAKMGAEGLIAYMLWHNYRMPTKEELDKAEIAKCLVVEIFIHRLLCTPIKRGSHVSRLHQLPDFQWLQVARGEA